ncbi:MAG: uroporphyrinogen decarboxylase family protein [Anaerolineae bacterium]
MTTDRERFLDCMAYRGSDRRPNHELGVWPQTRIRWLRENRAAVEDFGWNWFYGEDTLGLDRRDYVPVYYGFRPRFKRRVIEETPEYEVVRHANGILTRALVEGSEGGGRMCMDQYLDFPVHNLSEFRALKRRLIAAQPSRYPADLGARIEAWRTRACPLVLGENCAANGFYWRAREFMGTEALSYAWYDQPQLMHEMMAFYADFVIETSRPMLEQIAVDYFVLNEDMSMKAGPLLSPATYKTFIFPYLKRLVAFFREHGVAHIAVDTDGDPTALIPLLMDAGVDTLWPLERASDVDPLAIRRRFGPSLRLWGGVDKRVLAQGPAAIRRHLREMISLIEEGGFIPTVDHTVPPDVSWDDFCYYMEAKRALLAGDFGKLDG